MLVVAIVIIGAAVYLMVRRVEVRLVLLGAGLLMALVAGKPLAIADTFTRQMVAGMVGPICAAMGFAAVLGATGCDRHLVYLLLAPIRRVPWLVVPGGILAAYLMNMAVPSQTSTAAAVGPILVPLMIAAGIAPEIAGAALVLGASFGGDLLNPGAQDVQAVAGVTGISAPAISARVIPAGLAGAVVAAVVFALLNRSSRMRNAECGVRNGTGEGASADTGSPIPHSAFRIPHSERFRLSPVKALIPLVPVALLLMAYAGWPALAWLRAVPEGEEWKPLTGALPVVRAMLIGALLAAAVSWREIQGVTRSLFEGMGVAYGSIISLTITARCFGAGIEAIGVSDALLGLMGGHTALIRVLAAGFPWALATLSGSGSSPILTFAQTFLVKVDPRHDPVTLSALACLAGAFGRTMSPVAAVVVYSSALVGLSPIVLIRRLLPALLAGAVVALTVVLAWT